MINHSLTDGSYKLMVAPYINNPRGLTQVIILLTALSSTTAFAVTEADAKTEAADIPALERQVINLKQELESAEQELSVARQSGDAPIVEPRLVKPQPAQEAISDEFKIGPVRIGGAMRVNYVRGSYVANDDGPHRGGNGGNIELDTFRINMDFEQGDFIGKLEYRWYAAGFGQSYNFLHTGWLGYRYGNDSHVEVGVNRVPFGPGPYGVSQSYFFDQHYYVGLSDDMDLGIKYVSKHGNWTLDTAYYAASEGNWNGRSEDSARYSYDAVTWKESVNANGNVTYGGPVNGYQERNQVNFRAVYAFDDISAPTDLGISLQYGQLKGTSVDDGTHWAASAHMINQMGAFKLASQLTRYEIEIDANNPWGTDALIPFGAYDFAWLAATKAWIPAVSLSYKYETGQIPWLDYILPYIEYSSIIQDESNYNNSQMVTLGSAWASGGWYIYSDLVYSNGNFFIGNDGDDYSNIFDGVGDFGANGNDKWNYRFNINLGYYY